MIQNVTYGYLPLGGLAVKQLGTILQSKMVDEWFEGISYIPSRRKVNRVSTLHKINRMRLK